MRIAMILEGGLVSSVITDRDPHDTQAVSVDMETDGAEDDELSVIGGKAAVLDHKEVTYNPQLLDEIFSVKGYTVVLLYPDYSTSEYGSDIYASYTPAKSPEQAVEQVQKDASVDNMGDIPPEDFKAVVVVEGEHSIMGPLELEGGVNHGE